MKSMLPPSTFVEFNTRRLIGGVVAWENSEITNGLDLRDFFYCVPLASEPLEKYTFESKIYLAERYGGDGINSNGGGVRCGLSGAVQVKGIGRNSWLEYAKLTRTAQDLVCYLRKFLPETSASSIIPPTELLKSYEQTMTQRLMIEFLKLTGIRETWLLQIDVNTLKKCYKSFCRIFTSGNQEPFKIAPQHVSAMPNKMGNFHLNSTIKILSLSGSEAEADNALAVELPDADLRNQLIPAYFDLKNAFHDQIPQLQQKNARCFSLLNAIRLNTPFPELYRPVLDRTLDQIIDGKLDAKACISTIAQKAKTLLRDPHMGKVDLSAWFEQNITVGEMVGPEMNGHPVTAEQVIGSIPEEILNNFQRKMAKKLCEKVH